MQKVFRIIKKVEEYKMLKKRSPLIKLATLLLVISPVIASANSTFIVHEPDLPKKLTNNRHN